MLALGYVVLAFLEVHDYDLGLFHGGYLWLALFTAILIGVLAHPAARLGGLLALPPMVWLGLRSYSFYLWHWPVLALTRPGIDVSMPRGILIPLQLLAVLALAELSYRFVELPFRRRRRWPARAGWERYTRPALLAGVPAVVLLVGWSGIVSSGERDLDAERAASTAEFAKVEVEPRRGGRQRAGAGARPNRPPRVVAFGDSVMIGAKERLAARLGPRFSMNAKVGRQADEFVEIAERLKAGGGQHRRPDRPDGQQRAPLQRRNGGPAAGDPQGRRPLPGQRPCAGLLDRGVQRAARGSRPDLAPHRPRRLGLGRRRSTTS